MPLRFAVRLWRHRDLVCRLTRRRLEDMYRGSVLGPLWALITPALMLIAYSFAFDHVLHARRPPDFQGAQSLPFALFLFSGLLPFWLFAECIAQAPSLMRANRVLIRQVLFPVEVLPAVTLLVALFRMAVGSLIFAVAFLVWVGLPSSTWLLAPLALAPVLLWALGAIWVLASLGVYFEDLGQLVGVMTALVLFLSPVFYPLAFVPDAYESVYLLNPLAVPIEGFRSSLLGSPLPSGWLWLAVIGASCLWAELSFAWFERHKGEFSDVL